MANNNHFDLTLDTLAPQKCSITRQSEFVKDQQSLTISANNAAYMKVWFSEKAEGTASDPNYPTNWEAYGTSKTTNFTSNGIYYYHAILKDTVNNESSIFNTERIVFDTTPPSISGVYMQDPESGDQTITNNKTGIKYGFTFSDTLSGIDHAIVTGDDIAAINITAEQLGTSPFTGTLDFKAGVHDGTKTINVTIYDKAGNSASGTATITLDTELTKPVLVLLKNQETEESLPQYINYTNIKAKLTDDDTDIVAYKIWENGQIEPEYTTQEAGAVKYIKGITLSSGDGEKTIHAKVKDKAGTEVEAEIKTVTVDTVKPTVSLVSDKTIISKIQGYNTAILTLVGSDSLAGVKSWALKRGDTAITSGTGSVSTTYNLTSDNSLAEGINTITLEVMDNAENTTSASVDITLDTTSPSVSINTLNEWYNAQFNITVTNSDSSGVAKLEVWTSTVASDQTVPDNTAVIESPSSPYEVAATSIKWNFAQSADNYMHVKATDKVGNTNYAHTKFGYDDVAPTAATFKFDKAVYNSATASITIAASDSTSGVTEMRISGDITNATEANSWETYAVSKSVTLTEGDGYKYVTIIFKDKAGNTSVNTGNIGVDKAETELDMKAPTASISLQDPNDADKSKENYSAVPEFKARINYTEEDHSGHTHPIQYKLYGDFAVGQQGTTTEADAQWTTFKVDDGKKYMTINNLFCSDNSGDEAVEKIVYVKFKDAAGNESEAAKASFWYDKSAPIVTVSDVDHNIISKIHAFRHSSASEVSTKYADEVHFSFTPDEPIQAYKVVAYKDQSAATAGSATDSAIPTTGGSTNMSATGLDSANKVDCMIRGADFETALGGEGNDGAHIVVVYVQNKAGTWSVAAEFSA